MKTVAYQYQALLVFSDLTKCFPLLITCLQFACSWYVEKHFLFLKISPQGQMCCQIYCDKAEIQLTF
jgi:hypothetical protein